MLLEEAIRLTRRFYTWERRGRGWASYPFRVALEPPFVPFEDAPPPPPTDDGRCHTWLSSIFERLGASSQKRAKEERDDEELEPLPEPWKRHGELIEFALLLPEKQGVPRSVASAWLKSLSTSAGAFSYELIGQGRSVAVHLSCSEEDLPHAVNQTSAYFPMAGITSPPEGMSLAERWASVEGYVSILEFGLAREFMLPLFSQESWNPDPLTPLIGSLADAGEGELAIVQVLFESVREPWEDSVLRAVTTPDGKPFFADAPELTKMAESKVASGLYAVVLRLAAVSPSQGRSWQIVRSLASGLSPLGSTAGNELVPLGESGLGELEADLVERATHRPGMLLSLQELVSLVHPPGETVRVPELIRLVEKEPQEAPRPLPAAVTEGDTILGEYRALEEPTEVRLDLPSRLRHMHVIGASGTGKSTFLVNLILQDIAAGRGVGVLDPHGDLVDAVLARMPKERADDVIVLDPADPDVVIGWNVLAAHSQAERNILASDLVAAFRRLSTAWGDQMTTVLSNAVLVFLEHVPGGTLIDLRNFLVDERYRQAVLAKVRDEFLISYWRQEFPMIAGKKPQGPILTRLNTFLRSRLIREVVTERERGLDFRQVIDGRRILLARLSQGAIGEENAALLGSLLVSKLHQVTLSRQDQTEAQREPFFLYIDELHEMATPSMASLFTGVRKYRLGVTVAHQDLYQLHAAVPEVERALLDNAHVRVCFRLGDDDARKLANGFSSFSADDLGNLGTGEAICRVGRKEDDFRLHVPALPEIVPDEADGRRAELLRRSKEKYGRRREVLSAVEMQVEESPRTTEAAPPPSPIESPRDERPTHSVDTEMATSLPPKAPPSPIRAHVPTAHEEATPGRGGPEHKYLQELIGRWGADRGFRTSLERELPDGGWVDVALEREGRSIACEISVTTRLEKELANVTKCLEARRPDGAFLFDHVAVVSLKKTFLKNMKVRLDEDLASPLRDRVGLYAPEEFFAFLSLEPPPATEGTVAGYKVKVKYKKQDDAVARKKAIAETIMKSLKKLKGKE